MQLSVVVDLVQPGGEVFAVKVGEVHIPLLVVEGADVHDARWSRAFQQI